MSQVIARFYAELNDFLSPERRGKDIIFTFQEGEQIFGFLHSIGVPPEKVDLILLNGASVGLYDRLKNNDRLSCYPVFESFDIRNVTRIRPMPLRRPTFAVDAHLGKLATFLRLLGFDTVYQPGITDDKLLDISLADERAILSKDRRLLEHRSITRGYRVLSDDPREQLGEVLHRFDLYSSVSPFTRCLRCNTLFETILKETIIDRLPLKVQQFYDEFYYCRQCDQVFWKGSHYQKMKVFVDDIVGEKPK